MIERELKQKLELMLDLQPAVGLLGPRQVGKTTLAHEIAAERVSSLYLDLESPADRASGGAEIDLVLSLPPKQLWAVEIKRSLSPGVERGFHEACEDLQPTKRFVVHPGLERFPLGKNITAISLAELLAEIKKLSL